MKILKPITDDYIESNNKFFDPCNNKHNNGDYKKMVCCCGYELIKADNNTYECTGGNHKYNIMDGQVIIDKYGNILFKIPENNNKDAEK